VKIRWVVLASVALGILLGAGVTWAHFGGVANRVLPETPAARPVVTDGSPPKLVVDSRTHDFGYVGRYATVQHAFRITNLGKGLLTLKAGSTTCSACTIAKLSRTELLSGETGEVVVAYSPTSMKPFRQIAVVHTNDPDNPRLELHIRGLVSSEYTITPEELVFSSVASGETARAELKAYSFREGPFRITGHQFTDASTASRFDVAIDAIPAEALPPRATAGYRVTVTLKPGLLLGTFQQTIRLTLELGEPPQVVQAPIAIQGTIVSDLSIVGPQWNNDRRVLNFGTVNSTAGAERQLTVLARGEARGNVQLEPLRVEPPWLEVKLGERTKLNDSVDRIPLEVRIPPGQAPAIHLGNDQGAYGQIVLGVKDHPDITEIQLNVRFVIED
jgi:hypothetical protein